MHIAYYIIPITNIFSFGNIKKAWLIGIEIIIIVHRSHVTKTSYLHSQEVPTGKGNIIANFKKLVFVFINAHLAARAEK